MRFEDLLVWQKSRILTAELYELSGKHSLAKDYALSSQMKRAAVSVMSNIAEGFDRSSKAEYARFLAIAKGSCAELRAQLYIAMDTKLLPKESCLGLFSQAEEISKMLGGLEKKVRASITA